MSETSAMAAKRTPLQESQKETGAVFAELLGVTVVTSYGDSLLEYGAVRGSAGLIDLSAGGAIEAGGKEGIQFLNGLITNNVKTLEKGKGIQAAFLTGHGKVR